MQQSFAIQSPSRTVPEPLGVNMQNAQNQIWTPKQAAAWLGLSESTMAKQRLTGSGPVYIKLGARRVGYREADLEAWVQANRCRSTSEYAG